ncbi:MAG: hypothetical protein ACFFD1_05270 [Candidatus Thorarchaeota archaeon]
MGTIDDELKYEEEKIQVKTQADLDCSSICASIKNDIKRYWCYLGWTRKSCFDIILSNSYPDKHKNKRKERAGTIYIVKQDQSYSLVFLDRNGSYKEMTIDQTENQEWIDKLQNKIFDGSSLVDDETKQHIYDTVTLHSGRTHTKKRQWPLRRKTIDQYYEIIQQQDLTKNHFTSVQLKINKYEQSRGVIRWFLGWVFRIGFLYKQFIYHHSINKKNNDAEFMREEQMKESMRSIIDTINQEYKQTKNVKISSTNNHAVSGRYPRYDFLYERDRYKKELRRYYQALRRNYKLFKKSAKKVLTNEELSFKQRIDDLERYKIQVDKMKYTLCPEYHIKKSDQERLWGEEFKSFSSLVDKLIRHLEKKQKNPLDKFEQNVSTISERYRKLIAIKDRFMDELNTLPRYKLRMMLSQPSWNQKRKVPTSNEILIIFHDDSYQIGYGDSNEQYRQIHIDKNEYPELIAYLKGIKDEGQIAACRELEQIYEIITLEEGFPYVPTNRHYDNISEKWSEIEDLQNSACKKITKASKNYQRWIEADEKESEVYNSLCDICCKVVITTANVTISKLKQQLPLVPSVDTVPTIILRWDRDSVKAMQFAKEQVRTLGQISNIQEQHEMIGISLKIMNKMITELYGAYHPDKFPNSAEVQKIAEKICKIDIPALKSQMRKWLIKGSQVYLKYLVEDEKEVPGKQENWESFESFISKCINGFRSSKQLDELEEYYELFSDFGNQRLLFQNKQKTLMKQTPSHYQNALKFWQDSFTWVESKILIKWSNRFENRRASLLEGKKEEDEMLWDASMNRFREKISPDLANILASYEKIENEEKSFSHQQHLKLIDIKAIMQLDIELSNVERDELRKRETFYKKARERFSVQEQAWSEIAKITIPSETNIFFRAAKDFRLIRELDTKLLRALRFSYDESEEHLIISKNFEVIKEKELEKREFLKLMKACELVIFNKQEEYLAKGLNGLSNAARLQRVNVPPPPVLDHGINSEKMNTLKGLRKQLLHLEHEIENQYKEYLEKGEQACAIDSDFQFDVHLKLLMIWIARSNIKTLRLGEIQWHAYWQGEAQPPSVTWKQWCQDYREMLRSLEQLIQEYEQEIHYKEEDEKIKENERIIKQLEEAILEQESTKDGTKVNIANKKRQKINYNVRFFPKNTEFKQEADVAKINKKDDLTQTCGFFKV